MKYYVIPKRSRKGLCRISCKSMERAESERKKLEAATGFEWEVITE